MRGGAFEVKSHPWFAGINWKLDVDSIGPIFPKDVPPGDTSNFSVDNENGSNIAFANQQFVGDQSIFANF